jgi:sugar lactone lactonase YvrE
MFIVGEIGDDVNEYTLSTGFDVSTASFVDSFSVSAQDTSPTGIAFNTDGTKMFVVGSNGDDVNEYTLSTGFDVSTASFVDSFSVAPQETNPIDIAFNTDGTKMFIVGGNGQDILEYALSAGFDVSTASYTQNFSVASQETGPTGMTFNTDGTKMFVVGNVADNVNSYDLSIGFDLSTASFASSFSVAANSTSPQAISFNTDGTKMFIVDSTGDDVNEYDLDFSALQLGTGSFVSADVGKTIEANSGVFVLTATSGAFVETTAPTSYDQVASGDWDMYGVVYNAADGDLELSSYLSVYSLPTASYDSVFFSGVTTPNDLAFKSDGSVLYVLGRGADILYQYPLSAPFDISTASTSTFFDFNFSDAQGLAFSTDGTKFYIQRGSALASVYEYSMSTAWDVTTATLGTTTSVSSEESTPSDIKFKSDGTKFYVIGTQQKTVFQYSLSTPWATATRSYDSVSFSLNSEDTDPQGLFFNSDGTKMFMVGFGSDTAYAYTLSSAWDVSSLSYTGQSFSVSSQENDPRGLAFNTDGTKMFVSGNQQSRIHQYSTTNIFFPTGYQPVHTTASTDTTYWTDINSMTADQNAGDG